MNYSIIALSLLMSPFCLEVSASQLKRVRDDSADFLMVCGQGNYEEVERFLEEGVLADTSDDIATALYYAIKGSGSCELVKLLLDNGADINKGSVEGNYTPLIVAIELGWLDCFELLLEYKADPEIGTDDGFLPLHAAAQMGQMAMCEKLLACGVNIDKTSHGGCTALGLALSYDKLKIARFLFQKGAKFDVKRVIMETSSERFIAIIEQLFSYLTR